MESVGLDFVTGCNTSYHAALSDIPIDLIRLLESINYSQLILIMQQFIGQCSINSGSSSCFRRNMFG